MFSSIKNAIVKFIEVVQEVCDFRNRKHKEGQGKWQKYE